MSSERANDCRAFYDFLGGLLEDSSLTLGDALELWDQENQTPEELKETLAAIREGLADAEAGRVRPARESINEIRRKYNLPELR